MKNLSLTLLSCILFSVLFANDIEAQNSEKRLQIVYIDHEVTTPTDAVNRRLTERFYQVSSYESDALIIYLSNGRRSPMAFVNLKEFLTENQLALLTSSGQPRDTEEAFRVVKEALNSANSHTVDAKADINNILELIDRFNVFDENGKLNYKELRFEFYIEPNFWLLRNNEKVIARLYSLLFNGIPSSEKEKISFRVLKPKGTQLEYSEGQPFGDSNLDGINEEVNIMDY